MYIFLGALLKSGYQVNRHAFPSDREFVPNAMRFLRYQRRWFVLDKRQQLVRKPNERTSNCRFRVCDRRRSRCLRLQLSHGPLVLSYPDVDQVNVRFVSFRSFFLSFVDSFVHSFVDSFRTDEPRARRSMRLLDGDVWRIRFVPIEYRSINLLTMFCFVSGQASDGDLFQVSVVASQSNLHNTC